jgi:hypothetical protein
MGRLEKEDQTFSARAVNYILLKAIPTLSQSIGSSNLVPRIAIAGESAAS